MNKNIKVYVNTHLKKPILAIGVIVLYMMVIYKFVLLYKADTKYVESQKFLTDARFIDALNAVTQAINTNPSEPIYRRGRAQVYLSTTIGQDKNTQNKLKTLALTDLADAYNLNTKNLATIRNSIPLYYFLSTKDLALPPNSYNVDSEFLPITRAFYNHVKNVSPNDVGIYVLLAKYQKRLGLTDDYNASIEKVRSLRPDLLNWYSELK